MTALTGTFRQSVRTARTLADTLRDTESLHRIEVLETQASLLPAHRRSHLLAELLRLTDALHDRLDRGY